MEEGKGKDAIAEGTEEREGRRAHINFIIDWSSPSYYLVPCIFSVSPFSQ